MASASFGTFGLLFFNYFLWLRITDEGSIPEMRIWSILLIKSDLKWCIHVHLSRSIYLYTTTSKISLRILIQRKRKRSDSVLWQKPLHQQKYQKGKVTTQTTPQKSSIKQRLRTDLGRSVGVRIITKHLPYFHPQNHKLLPVELFWRMLHIAHPVTCHPISSSWQEWRQQRWTPRLLQRRSESQASAITPLWAQVIPIHQLWQFQSVLLKRKQDYWSDTKRKV